MKEYKLLEIKRQAFHLFLGASIVLLLCLNLMDAKVLLVLLVAGFLLSAVSRKKRIPVIHWFLRNFERADALKRFPGKGLIFFITGSLLAVVFFQKDIALASITILTLGDSVSHLVGRFLGRTRHPLSSSGKVLIEGSIAGTIAAFLGAMLFIAPVEALAAAFIAMLVEVLEVKINEAAVDDNILLPVVAGATITLVRMII